MSYGIWRKRGKGWSSIEIDTPGNDETLAELRYEQPEKYRVANHVFGRVFGQDYSDYDDLAALKWKAGQLVRNPHRWIASYSPGGGEHERWVSFDGPEALFDRFMGEGNEDSGFYGWTIEFNPGLPRIVGWYPPKDREEIPEAYAAYRAAFGTTRVMHDAEQDKIARERLGGKYWIAS